MTFWPRYAGRSLLRSGRRAFFALICVAVGVASVVALQTAALTVRNALTSNVRAANGGDISMQVQAAPLAPRDLALFRRLSRQGRITDWTAVSTVNAVAVGTSGHLVPFDVNAVAANYPVGGQPTFVSPANGSVQRLLQRPGDVLVTSTLADLSGARVGSRLFVRGVDGGGVHVVVRGVLAATSFARSSAMTMRARDTRPLSRTPTRYSAVYLNVPGSPGPVASLLRNRFPVAQVQTVREALQSTQQQVHDFQQFLLLVGLMALLIAGIGILNAMQSMLVWRRLEIAMLKAMGYRRGALYLLFGGEALLLGSAGGLLGTVAGAAISKIITGALATAMAVQVTFQLDAGTLLAGVALGMGATLLFSLLPIVRAAAFRPLEILREGTALSPIGWGQTAALLAIVLLLFAALAAAIMGDVVLSAEFVGVSAAIALLFSGLFALVVLAMGRLGPPRHLWAGRALLLALLGATGLAARGGSPLAPLLGLAAVVWGALVVLPPEGRLPLVIAVRSLGRRLARTSVTLVAFLIGVLAMSLTLTVALSLRSQINQLLASGSRVNLVALADPAGIRRLDRAATRLTGVQARSDIVVVNTQPVRVNGRPLASVIGPARPTTGRESDDDPSRALEGITGLALARGQGATDVRLIAGRPLGPSDAGTANVLLSSELLRPPYSLDLGDTVGLREPGASGVRTVRAIGFYRRPRGRHGFGSFFRPPIYADRSLPLAIGGQDAQYVLSFSIASDRLTHDAALLQQRAPSALVVDIGDLTAVVDTILNELLNLLAVITALSLGAGLSVVGNGVALAMLERRREIAVYKAIGFGPASVLRFVLVENALVGTLAGAVSVLLVVVSLAILARVALQRAIGFDPVVAVLVLLGATALAVITAYLAARTPVRVRPIEVLRNE